MKNTLFDTRENQSLNEVFLMMESLSCLSEKFTRQITNLALWIGTNHSGHDKEITDAINKLETGLYFVSIFNPTFINKLIWLLKQSLHFEHNVNYADSIK
jgi:hypothetical protein